MNDKLNEDLNQLLVVDGVCAAYPLAMAKIPQMVLHKATLEEIIENIKQKAQITGTPLQGLYVVKSTSKTDLVLVSEAGCAAIRSYAKSINDVDLLTTAKYKGYQLEKLHKNDLITVSTNCHAKAVLLGALLVPHGFAATDITEWGHSITAFSASADVPAVKVEINKSNLAGLVTMVADGLRWVRTTMDDTALGFKRKDPDFFQLYTFAREKHHQAHHHRPVVEGEIITPGEYYLDILRGGTIVRVGFPILPDKTYLIENVKNCRLRFWTQATPDAPTEIPAEAGIMEIGEELEKTGAILGAPEKPYMFFGNESLGEDGGVAINIV